MESDNQTLRSQTAESAGSGCYPLIIVTGLSGAGKSTALNVFEDLGFFTVDGLPVSLVPSVLNLFAGENPKNYRGLALGMDLRQPDFAEEWIKVRERLSGVNLCTQIIFLEASEDILVRRYATTRRPHPLESGSYGLDQALEMEKAILNAIRGDAHLVVDTSGFSIHDLRRTIQEKWEYFDQSFAGMRIHLISFGFKYGVPSEADMVFDLRFLPNPYFDTDLRPLSGKDKVIADYVLSQGAGARFILRTTDYLSFLVPMFVDEGRYRLTMAFGCTGGRHRSVAVVERIAAFLKDQGYLISTEHRHFNLG
ncbi:RNase adapter RapZ [Desulfonatronovibrio magnus]|uniref:RNase adapter RapZ n=1 Tax=Desulfonatronovibrio magnus TaxID=698827 RepID=UPI000A047207|nr:RNase adapter RapZ [Desulfonatronovibrio magnus]